MPTSPRNTAQAIDWLKGQRAGGHTWPSLCLALTRNARGIPALYPSALAAQTGTPKNHRFPNQAQWRRGMVAYFDNPGDGNPYGHIATLAYKGKDGVWRAWSNVTGGKVALVPITLFTHSWGDPAQFASDHLNGYDLKSLVDRPPTPLEQFEKTLRGAVQDLRAEAERQDKRGHAKRADLLRRDIRLLRKNHPKVFG